MQSGTITSENGGETAATKTATTSSNTEMTRSWSTRGVTVANATVSKVDGLSMEGHVHYLNKEYLKAFQWFTANKVDPECMYMLGRMYWYGQGVGVDHDTALSYFHKAAEEHGHASAQRHLGRCLMGEEEDANDEDLKEEDALRYLRLASDQGHAEASFQIATRYLHGTGGIQKSDPVMAARYYQLAADGDHQQAQFLLGEMCASGKGVSMDTSKAMRMFKRAADKGHVEAQVHLLRDQDLGRMKISERNELTKEICGFGETFLETADSIRSKLIEFQRAVDRIPDKPAYNKARLIDVNYVNNPDLQLMSLRAECFDVIKAARRYVSHFDFKLSLFGLDKLAQTITYDDLDEHDKSIINDGFLQYMTKRDRAGRLVAVLSQEHQRFASYESLLRMVWYLGHKHMGNDITSQQKGMVLVLYNVNLSSPSQLFRDQMRHGDRLSKCSLYRSSAVHYCYNDTRLNSAMAVFQIVLGRSIRLRFCPHFGSHLECRYKLASYGVPMDVFPIDMDGNIRPDDHRRSIQTIATTERQEKENKRIMEDQSGISDSRVVVTSRDVLFGRGRGVLGFPGNQHLSRTIVKYFSDYERGGRAERTKLTSCIVDAIKAENGRFLVKESEVAWRVATDSEARLKVAHAFRNMRQKVTEDSPSSGSLRKANEQLAK